MPQNLIEKACCTCLESGWELKRLTTHDEEMITLQLKLQTCISEINWLSSYQICETCENLLNVSYTFRETCLKSELERQKTVKDELDPGPFLYELQNAEPTHLNESNIDTSTNGSKPSIDVVKGETTDDDNDDSFYRDEVLDNDPNYPESAKEKKPEKTRYIKSRSSRKTFKRKKLNFSCEKCDVIYNSSIKLINHCIKDHGMQKLDVRPFTCDRCPSRFCNSSNLLQHVKYHDAVRSNMCTYCGKGFITKTDLNIHEKQHLNKREYACDECEKCFNTHKDLRSHKLVVHTNSDSWKYSCEICNKPFPIKSNYDSHMRRHSGERNFECHICQRKFIDKCVMQRHMRTHSNVREYKCPHCVKEYKDRGVLKVHMAKVHGIGVGLVKIPAKEKKYICHICPKSYYAKNKLTRHLYTHSGEKPFECPICGRKFNDKSYVKQHLKKSHNTEDWKPDMK